jgi:hypothetical protein
MVEFFGTIFLVVVAIIMAIVMWGWPFILLFLILYIPKKKREKKLALRNNAIATFSAEKGLSVSQTQVATSNNNHFALAIDSNAHKAMAMVLNQKDNTLIQDTIVNFECTHVFSNLDLYDKKSNDITPMSLLVNEKENKLLVVAYYNNACVVQTLNFSEILSVEVVKDSKTITVGSMVHGGTGIGSVLVGGSSINTVSENVTLSFQIKVVTRIISMPFFMFDIYCKTHKRSYMGSQERTRATQLLSVLSIIVDKGNRMIEK